MNHPLLVTCLKCSHQFEVTVECNKPATPIYKVYRTSEVASVAANQPSAKQRKMVRNCPFCDEQLTIMVEDC